MSDMVLPPSFEVKRNKIIIPGMTGCFKIMHITDAHVSPDSPLDPEELREKAAEKRKSAILGKTGLSHEENLNILIEYGKSEGCELFVFSGDVMAFPSEGIVEYLLPIIKATGEYIFVPGNHEGGADKFPGYSSLMKQVVPGFEVREYPFFKVIGLDNNGGRLDEAAWEILKTSLLGDKPIILVQHRPITVEPLLTEFREIHKNVGFYFFGHKDNGYERREEIFELLRDKDTSLAAVLAGHLHIGHEDNYPNGVPQYVTAPAFEGGARIIEIKGE